MIMRNSTIPLTTAVMARPIADITAIMARPTARRASAIQLTTEPILMFVEMYVSFDFGLGLLSEGGCWQIIPEQVQGVRL